MEQEQFLPNEDVRIAVRITNLSGQTLRLGADSDWLALSVESIDKRVVSKLGEVPVQGEFTLATTHAATKRLNLTPYFNFRHQGRYQVIATVKVPQWEQMIGSGPQRFDVINGTILREIDFGVPLPPGVSGKPEFRKYLLQQANYLKQLKLYVRLTDASGQKTFRVLQVGSMVSFGRPETQLDQSSNLHIMHQIGARAFNYAVITPDGELLVKETYDISGTTPRLGLDDSGKIRVLGGVLRTASSDKSSPATKSKHAAESQSP